MSVARLHVEAALVSGVSNVLWPRNYSLTHAVLDGFVYEHNTFQNVPTGYSTEGFFTGTQDFADQAGSLANQFFYANTFSGKSGLSRSALTLTAKVALRQNQYAGFSTDYQTTTPKPVLEMPMRVIDLIAPANSEPVQAQLTLWNAGTKPLPWQARSSAAWLSVLTTSNTIPDERSSSSVVLVANPAMSAGEHTALVTVTADDQVLQATVKLTIQQAPAPPALPPLVQLVSPATNSTFVASTAIPIVVATERVDSIANVEFFAGPTQLGEAVSPPYSFTWHNAPVGVHTLMAKVTDRAGNVLPSNLIPITVLKPAGSTCANRGSLDWRYWVGQPIWAILPDFSVTAPPTMSMALTSFATPVNLTNQYGSQAKGFVCPPVDGTYVFYIAGDDIADLYLSTDDNPANRKKIATADWTCFGQYDKSASQQSVPIPLQAGRLYYVEVLHFEGNGDDYVSVGWKLPDGTLQRPIAGAHLVPFQLANPTTPPASFTISSAGLSLDVFTNKRVVRVGDTVSYHVRVQNDRQLAEQTTGKATWSSRLPAHLQILDHAGLTIKDSVLSGPINPLGPLGDTTFTFRATPTAAGTYRLLIQTLPVRSSNLNSSLNAGTIQGESRVASTDFRTVEAADTVYTSPESAPFPPPTVLANPIALDSAKADLSVNLILTSRSPKLNDLISCTVSVSNAGGTIAHQAGIRVALPIGLQFANGSGWALSGQTLNQVVDLIRAGTTVHLPFQVRAVRRGVWTTQTQIHSSGVADPDSTPGTGNGEDDHAQTDLRVR